MGCACSKGTNDDVESAPEKVTFRHQVRHSSGSVTVDTTDPVNGSLDKESKIKSMQNGATRVPRLHTEAVERRRERILAQAEPNPRLSNLPRHLEGEQVAAGWPAWLSAVAGDAIKGWIPRRADSFEKLEKIGQGTYSNVYKARDLDSGKIVALKKVRFDNLEPESVRFMAREIQVLRRLDHPNVVKLEGLVTSRMSCSLYLVFEYMEHDLAGLAACPGITFTEAQVKCYLQQLLLGLDHCHSRGVLHRDIKGSNLLLDNGGILKIADFGLATMYHPEQKQALTSRVVTLWYRPPELLLGATEYGVAVDLWSTGCILAELLAGKPITPGRTEVEQLHKIFKLCGSPSEEYWKRSKLPHATIFKPQQPYKRCIADTFKSFPISSLALIETLLSIEPDERGTASAALMSDFFTTKPFACDPASLPQYPPSKEFDAKLREEEARRKRAASGKGPTEAARRQGSRERSGKAVPAPDANAELQASLQKRRIHPHSSKSKSEKFTPRNEDTAVGFPIEPPGPSQPLAEVHTKVTARHQSGIPTVSSRSRSGAGPGLRRLKDDEGRMVPRQHIPQSLKSITVSDFSSQDDHGQEAAAELSNISTLVAGRNVTSGEPYKDMAGEMSHTQVNSLKREHFEALSKKDHHLSSSRADLSYQIDGNHRRDGRMLTKEKHGSESQTERMYHSGPLIRPGYASTDIEELLKDHERKMQQAARRAAQEMS
ncbi:hypothetical protein O6H91_13G082500 [Diphasiastrum complanatum]|uniref:Uncharacterized protein n=7 Tax=Diphasiastrum complanatum TaxID=34168 RepID=A0ACC2BWM3_DIPCM|nr:hypothetical protein O6H91_13G082500 [Diphasiastrum complanatum]KAJ7534173.1 hypothetical protein O6H91_13G082500 [Diphasiastrum complanatum]KAJ7534174.1 hypothetical protein O6H91_13G082500 [Diphasiastrum complanatum]KAJ7534175.1 hypothetical protein O6H91_13G082500 [Diphasiastrum complanatum]KAJ7534176.1 hypothetical protein O6H91_13G082500 [Diphasiastrum complanatum]